MKSLELVKALLAGGAKVNVSTGNEDSISLLSSATHNNHKPAKHTDPELVRILLNAGAPVNSEFGKRIPPSSMLRDVGTLKL